MATITVAERISNLLTQLDNDPSYATYRDVMSNIQQICEGTCSDLEFSLPDSRHDYLVFHHTVFAERGFVVFRITVTPGFGAIKVNAYFEKSAGDLPSEIKQAYKEDAITGLTQIFSTEFSNVD